MNLNELATVSARDLPIVTVVIKNNTLGMVRQWQKLFFNKRFSCTDLSDVICYEKLADAFGLKGYLVHDIKSLKAALEEVKARGKGAVIACEIFVDEDVAPMVPPGGAIDQQLLVEPVV
jgi:acetolactate synthase-1/2/3 large subunit